MPASPVKENCVPSHFPPSNRVSDRATKATVYSRVPLLETQDSADTPSQATDMSTSLSKPQSIRQVPDYFWSPFLTLKESLQHPTQVSLHDVIESYTTLSSRLRDYDLCRSDFEKSGEQILHLSNWLFDALHRDIRAIHDFPHPALRHGPYSREERKFELSTCHHAIKLTSIMFSDEHCYQLLNHHQILTLLHDLFSIIRQHSGLKVAATHKPLIFTLVFSALSHQVLPQSIFDSEHETILYVLDSSFKESLGGIKGKISTFKALGSLVRSVNAHPFETLSAKFLPTILNNLSSDIPDIRSEAAFALSGLVTGKFCRKRSPSSSSLADEVVRFIHEQETSGKVTLVSLNETLRKAISAPVPTEQVQGAVWSFVVVVSLVYLAEDRIFQPGAISDFFFSAWARFRMFKNDQTLRPIFLWSHAAMLWAFSRYIANHPQQQQNTKRTKQRMSPNQILNRIFERLSISSMDLAMIYIATFLNASPQPLLLSSFRLIKSIISRDDPESLKVAGQVLLLLVQRKTEGRPTSPTDLLFCRTLFQDDSIMDPSSSLLHSQGQDLIEIIGSAIPSLDLEPVRSLTKEEILRHWSNLFDLWKLFVTRSLAILPDLPDDVLNIFQGLVLTETEPQPSVKHLEKISQVLGECIDGAPNSGDTGKVYCLLGKLWRALVNCYSVPSATHIAWNILDHMLSVPPLDDGNVPASWNHLVADLFGFLSTIKRKELFSRVGWPQLWDRIANAYPLPSTEINQQAILDLLVEPYNKTSSQPLVDVDTQLWKQLLTISAGSSSAHSVLDELFDRCPSLVLTRLEDLLDVLVINSEMWLPLPFLRCINRSLQEFYPLDLDNSWDILRKLRPRFPKGSSNPLPFFHAMESVFLLFIRDPQNSISPEIYESEIIPLYTDVLHMLESVEPKEEILIAITPFLVSIFEPENVSPHGSEIFMAFWSTTYQLRPELVPFYSNTLKACLSGCNAVFGGSMEDGFSLGSHFSFPESSSLSPSFLRNPSQAPISPRQLAENDAEISRLPRSLRTKISDLQRKAGTSFDFAKEGVSFMDTTLATPPSVSLMQPRYPRKFVESTIPVGSGNTSGPGIRHIVAQETLAPLMRSSEVASGSSTRPASRKRKLIFDGVEVPTLLEVKAKRRKPARVIEEEEEEEEEDYNSWENPIHAPDLQNLQMKGPSSPIPCDLQGPLSPLTSQESQGSQLTSPSSRKRRASESPDPGQGIKQLILMVSEQLHNPDLETQALWDARVALGRLGVDMDAKLDEKNLARRVMPRRKHTKR